MGRVLVLVHKTIDRHFPEAAGANRQFSKTVFSDDEPTAIGRIDQDTTETNSVRPLPEETLLNDESLDGKVLPDDEKLGVDMLSAREESAAALPQDPVPPDQTSRSPNNPPLEAVAGSKGDIRQSPIIPTIVLVITLLIAAVFVIYYVKT